MFGKKKNPQLKALEKEMKQEKKENDWVDKKLSNLYKRLEEAKKNKERVHKKRRNKRSALELLR